MTERDLFIAALQLEHPAQRQACLEEACAGRPGLREQVENLLRLHEGAGSFLERPAVDPATGAFLTAAGQAPPCEAPGMMIGPYKLVERLGEGGMGTVWLAQQSEPVKRPVALKLIKAGMDSRQVIARFEAERQALALMDHPGIARVLDAGATHGGRPYFVMDLVKGVAITRYCDEHRLTPRQRLELFIPVCHAVQHAHQKGVIHRDLKPSNVLVALCDGGPVPKVIDFGVAKATGLPLTDRTLDTGLGAVVGTLEYMSPEQAELNQLDVDTRSDVYSLGVLLYELLTGTTPLDRRRLKGSSLLELLRLVREQDAPTLCGRLDTAEDLPAIAASRGLPPASLSGQLRGELDWIVMKALAKERNGRYATPSDLAQDVRRYLADEPVLAGPPSAWYGFTKFVRRNRTGLAVALLALAFLVVLGAVAGWALRDREARDQEVAVESARKLALAEEGIRQALQRAGSSLDAIRAALNQKGGVQELLNQRAGWELHLRTAQVELAQARLLRAAAEGAIDADVAQALDRLEQQHTADEADFRLAVRLEKIRLDRANWVVAHFDFRTALREYPLALAGFGVLTRPPDAAAAGLAASPIREQLVAALDDWAYVAYNLRDDPLAERLLAVARKAQPDPAWGDRLRRAEAWRSSPEMARLMAEAPVSRLSPQLLCLAGSLHMRRPHQVAWMRRAQAQHPADFWLAFELGNSVSDPAEAALWFRVAIAIRPGNPTAYCNLGLALRDQKKLPEAMAAYQRALDLDQRHANAHNGLGVVYFEQRNYEGALAAYRQARKLSPDNPIIHTNIGFALSRQGKRREAIAAYRAAIQADRKDALAWAALGQALRVEKKLDDAVALFRHAIRINPRCFMAHDELGIALGQQQDSAGAIAAYRAAMKLDPEDADICQSLGNALMSQKRPQEAIGAFQEAIRRNPRLLEAHCNLGTAFSELGNHVAAAAAYREGLKIKPDSAAAWYNLGCALGKLEQADEAVAAYRRAIAFDSKDASYHHNLGIALRVQRRLDASVAAFQAAIKLDANQAPTHCELGFTYSAQGKLAEATAAYRQAIALNPRHAIAHNNLGHALRGQRKPDEAADAFQTAVDIDPNYTAAWCNLGLALCDQKKLDEAIAAHRKALDIDPGFAGAYHGIAVALLTQRKLPQAADALHMAIKLDPQDASARNHLGNVLAEQGKLDEAAAAYRQAVRINPRNSTAWLNLGIVLRKQRKLGEAVAALRNAIEVEPKYTSACIELGSALLDMRKPEEAAAVLRQAVKRGLEDAEIHYHLGMALVAQRKPDEGIAAYRQAIALRPRYPEAHCNLGSIYLKRGQFAQALDFYQKGHDLGSKRPGWRYPSASWVKTCEGLLAQEKRLPDVLAGKDAGAAELLSLAGLCLQYKSRYADAALLYSRAFAARPSLADGPNQSHRYNAARAAVLAASGKGIGADKLDAADKTRLRGQALVWLSAGRAAIARFLADDPEAAEDVENGLKHWLDNPDLADVRDARPLAELPEEERQRWMKLWEEVRDLVRRAGKK